MSPVERASTAEERLPLPAGGPSTTGRDGAGNAAARAIAMQCKSLTPARRRAGRRDRDSPPPEQGHQMRFPTETIYLGVFSPTFGNRNIYSGLLRNVLSYGPLLRAGRSRAVSCLFVVVVCCSGSGGLFIGRALILIASVGIGIERAVIKGEGVGGKNAQPLLLRRRRSKG